MSVPLIVIKDLSYSYPQHGTGLVTQALTELNLELYQGEYLAILGPNGSGKSTLARLLNGLLEPSQGSVEVAGLDTREAGQSWAVRSMVGMVFQNPDNQLVAASVEDDVAFGPENLGVAPAEIRQRVDRVLALLEMQGYQKARPDLLSGGQKQKVAIAGALAMQPRCLVLDEATSMLDPRGRKQVMEAVSRLHHEQQLTIVQITQFMEEALFADRVLVLSEGKLVALGTPAEVFSQRDQLRMLGLELPAVIELTHQLKLLGLAIPANITNLEQLLDSLVAHLEGIAKAKTPVGMSHGLVGVNQLTVNANPPAVGAKPALLQLRKVSYTYAVGLPWAKQALTAVDLEVQTGEFIGIVGHTGSGKSTLLQLLNGLIKPEAGQVLIRAEDIHREQVDWAQLRSQVGLLFQFPEHQLFEATIFEEVAFGPRNLKWSPAQVEQAVQQALIAVGLNFREYSQVSPFTLSYGQKRRVALAGILSMQPQVLVLDEPLAGLDPQGRRELLVLLRALNQVKQITIVMASHNMEELASCASRVVVLNQGQKVMDGTPLQVFSQRRELELIGLDIPEGAKLISALNSRGMMLATGPLTWEQAWQSICCLL